MSSEKNANGIERSKVFEAVLSSPGMNEKCKITLNPSRQTVVLLSHLIEQGLEITPGKTKDDLLQFLPQESADELQQIKKELLSKSGLIDFYDRLKNL